MSDNDFDQFLSSPQNGLTDFSFSDFLHIFILGDYELLLDMVSADIDDAENYNNNAIYHQDPVKNLMLSHTLRRFPFVATIPVIFSVTLFAIAISKLLTPFVKRMVASLDMGQLAHLYPPVGGNNTRRRRDVEEIMDVDKNLEEAVNILAEKVYKAIHELTEIFSDGQNLGALESLNGMDGKLARFVWKTRKLWNKFKEFSSKWKDSLPGIGKCVGWVIGCNVRFIWWQSLCKPFGLVNCLGVFGDSLKKFLLSLGEV